MGYLMKKKGCRRDAIAFLRGDMLVGLKWFLSFGIKTATAVTIRVHPNVILKTLATPVVSAISANTLFVSCFIMRHLLRHSSSCEEGLDFNPNQITND